MSLPSVVRAFVFNPNGQILMTKHKTGTPWVLPGGHVELGESLHEAMIRELHEEFGLTARFFDIDTDEILRHKGKKLKHYPLPITTYELTYRNKEGIDKSRSESIFLMETDYLENSPLEGSAKRGVFAPLKIQTSEIAEYKWFDADDILMMKPNIDTWDFIIEMLERIVGSDEE